MLRNGHWSFPVQVSPDNCVGFVYMIVDTFMKEYYIGKKFTAGHGKINNGVESNWRTYISSSKYVQTMINNRPKEEFEFIILETYKTKSGLAFGEVWSIVTTKGPLKKNCGNRLVPKIGFNVKEDITERHILRMEHALSLIGE